MSVAILTVAAQQATRSAHVRSVGCLVVSAASTALIILYLRLALYTLGTSQTSFLASGRRQGPSCAQSLRYFTSFTVYQIVFPIVHVISHS